MGRRRFRPVAVGGGLIDEYVLVIQPVAFGGGLPLFAGRSEALPLELAEARTFGSTALHIYRQAERSARSPPAC